MNPSSSHHSLKAVVNIFHSILKFLMPIVYETENGEGNGNPLQYSCLENPMAEGAL